MPSGLLPCWLCPVLLRTKGREAGDNACSRREAVIWLLFLDRLFGGVGWHGGPGFGRGDDQGFRAPEVDRDLGDFVGRIAELRIEAIESGLSGLDGIGVDLLEFFETLVAEDFTQGRIVVEATHGRAQRGHVERGAFAAFDDLGNKYRLGIRGLFAGFLHFLGKSLEISDLAGPNLPGDYTQS